MSLVEDTLRAQGECWQEIVGRVSQISNRELSPEAPKRILLFGVGSSFFAAKLAAYSLVRDKLRTRIPVVACSSMALPSEVVPTKGDWAFAFTHRGGSRPTIKAMAMAEQAGAFTVQVSARGVEEHPSARYFLGTSPLEKVEPHTMAVTGAVCAVTSLLLGTKAHEEWDALRSFPNPSLDLLRDRAKLGPSTILGEWEGEWLAREGALKLMEMARVPVRAFSSEEFFHGPRYSTSPEDPVWHVSMPKDFRNPDIEKLSLAHRINITGASPLAWVPALIELQWLALAVALNRGVDPDCKG